MGLQPHDLNHGVFPARWPGIAPQPAPPAERTHRAYLSLGANVAPATNLPAAVRRLAGLGQVVAVSRVYESAALAAGEVVDPNAPVFLNAAVLLETALDAPALRAALIELETALGRVRRPGDKFAPRPIDIDIMLFDDDIRDLGPRHIPDDEILTRAFVALPLAELDPNYIHPETGQTLATIASAFDASALRLRADVGLLATA